MIYKYAGQLVTNCFCKHNSCYRGIYSTGQCTEHFTFADFLTNCLDGIFYEGIHLPVTCTATDFIYEVGQHFSSFHGMQYFRMKLDCIKIFFLALCSCNRTV